MNFNEVTSSEISGLQPFYEANRVDPDQAAPIGAAWSGSSLIAIVYKCENW